MWSEDNLSEQVLNFCFYVGSGAGTQVRLGQQAFLGLSVLSGPPDVIFAGGLCLEGKGKKEEAFGSSSS